MKVVVRKVQIEDVAKLQLLVAEHIDGIEPGLVVLDSRLLLGHATIDVVGVDPNGALVLIATGLTANEEMLLKAVEAYSWSREYPESLERLYPSCVISDERPPRLVFVVERMPDAFHRKIKQLGFPEVDCVEFRLLDVDGTPAVYFESVLRLRRPTVTPPAPRIDTTPEAPASPENVIAMNGPVAARATSLKLQKLLNQAAVDAARTPRERAVTVREPASVVSLVSRHATAVAPTLDAAAPIVNAAPAVVRQPEPVVVPGPAIVTPEPTIAAPEPVVVAPAPVIVTPDPVVLPKAAAEPDADLMAQMQRALAAVDANATTPEPLEIAEPAQATEPTLELVSEPAPEPKLELESKLELVSEPVAAAEAPSAPSIPSPAAASAVPSMTGERVSLRSLPELSLRTAAPVTVPRPAPIAPSAAETPSVAPAAQPAAPPQERRLSFKDLSAALLGAAAVEATTPTAPAASENPAMADAVVELEPALTVEALIKSALDTPAPAAAAPVAAAPVVAAPAPAAAETPAPQPAQPAAALPLEFAGLQFPKDGVMTRQWMEFLSQMSNTK